MSDFHSLTKHAAFKEPCMLFSLGAYYSILEKWRQTVNTHLTQFREGHPICTEDPFLHEWHPTRRVQSPQLCRRRRGSATTTTGQQSLNHWTNSNPTSNMWLTYTSVCNVSCLEEYFFKRLGDLCSVFGKLVDYRTVDSSLEISALDRRLVQRRKEKKNRGRNIRLINHLLTARKGSLGHRSKFRDELTSPWRECLVRFFLDLDPDQKKKHPTSTSWYPPSKMTETKGAKQEKRSKKLWRFPQTMN